MANQGPSGRAVLLMTVVIVVALVLLYGREVAIVLWLRHEFAHFLDWINGKEVSR